MSELPKETSTNPNLAGVTEQAIPHSGGRNVPEQLREQPVHDFDNTSLEEAIDQGHIKIPTSPSPIPEAQPVTTSPEKKKRKGIMIGASAGLAGIAIVAASFIGVNNKDSGAPTEDIDSPKTDPKGTSEVVNEPAEPEAPAKSPELIEAEEVLNMPKPEFWDELDAMTLEEFNQQPIEKRVDYAAWLNRDAKRLAGLWYEASGNPRDKLPLEMTVSPDNTGEEIEANVRSLQRGAVSRHFDQFELEEVPLYPNLQREKMASSSFLYPGGPGAENWREAARNTELNGWLPDSYVPNNVLLADEEVIARSENYTITDQSGIERTAVDTTIREPDGKEVTATIVLIETAYTSQWIVLK